MKARINILIDAALLLATAAMAGTGLLIRTVLIPGYARWAVYGRNVELTFLGLDRHQWGLVHAMAAVAFAVLLVPHILLHGRLIVGVTRRLIPHKFARRLAVLLLICLAILLAAFPAFVRPEVSAKSRGHGGGRTRRGTEWKNLEGRLSGAARRPSQGQSRSPTARGRRSRFPPGRYLTAGFRVTPGPVLGQPTVRPTR